MLSTADLYDRFGEQLRACAPIFRDFGGRVAFAGAAVRVKCFEDNAYIKAALAEPGTGRVLVADCGGSMRCAMLGDLIAGSALVNGWAGVLLTGCVRDSAALAAMELGRFLSTNRPPGLSFRPPTASRQRAQGSTMRPLPLLEGERKSCAIRSVCFRQSPRHQGPGHDVPREHAPRRGAAGSAGGGWRCAPGIGRLGVCGFRRRADRGGAVGMKGYELDHREYWIALRAPGIRSSAAWRCLRGRPIGRTPDALLR